MRPQGLILALLKLVGTIALSLALLAAEAGASPKYKVLRSFGAGGGLYGSLILDAEGNLYGESWGGGVYGFGTAFELSPSAGGHWKRKVLHSFDWRTDGNAPYGSLLLDAVGNLYGTTSENGIHSQGAAFELSPSSKGQWAETKLFAFGSGHDGAGPHAGFIADGSGNLYGTTYGGGEYDEGTVFELTPESDGWEETILYSFCANVNPCTDGDAVYAGLTWDSAGNLYGTTEYGGEGVGGDWGTAYELEHQPDGTWKHILLHSFPASANDGKLVYGGLVLDKLGNLYGTTLQGGGQGCGEGTGCGTVYKLTPTTTGWKETVLYNFANPKNGAGPSSSLTFDASGNLWGTAAGGTGQCEGGCGVVFKMTPGSNGKWTYSAVHHFTGNDGAYPNASVVFDSKGSLYGTTELGGGGTSVGVVFEITP